MSDITLVSHLKSIVPPQGSSVKPASSGSGFAETLETMIDNVNKTQIAADQAVEKLQTGESKNLHEVMIAMEKADISLRLAVQMRNKVIEAYQEIMRMQV
jgi:flagellar hook-basal body complex protein FliE